MSRGKREMRRVAKEAVRDLLEMNLSMGEGDLFVDFEDPDQTPFTEGDRAEFKAEVRRIIDRLAS